MGKTASVLIALAVAGAFLGTRPIAVAADCKGPGLCSATDGSPLDGLAGLATLGAGPAGSDRPASGGEANGGSDDPGLSGTAGGEGTGVTPGTGGQTYSGAGSACYAGPGGPCYAGPGGTARACPPGCR